MMGQTLILYKFKFVAELISFREIKSAGKIRRPNKTPHVGVSDPHGKIDDANDKTLTTK